MSPKFIVNLLYHFLYWSNITVIGLVLAAASELLIISLDLVKNRIGVMSTDMRRNFIQVVLTQLIEKSPDAKVMKTVVKMVEEWVKAKVS